MAEHKTNHPIVGPAEALARLMDGNARFLRGESVHSGAGRGRPADLVSGQWPYATILGCSDSRVPPEILFDAGFGDLFVIRVAGNVVSAEVMGSIQYAGAHLNTRLFIVLGHDGCGAVKAALATKFKGIKERSRIALLLEDVLPALEDIDPALPPAAQLDSAVEANVRWSMRQIADTPEGRERLADGQLRLVGAIYEIATGRVRLL
jgi:carbonic anhydrase